jgi:hypothetical protein
MLFQLLNKNKSYYYTLSLYSYFMYLLHSKMIVHLPPLLYNLRNGANSTVRLIHNLVLQNKVLHYFQNFVYLSFCSSNHYFHLLFTQRVLWSVTYQNSKQDDGFESTRERCRLKKKTTKGAETVSLNKDGVGTFRRSLYYDLIADFEAYNSTCITVLQAPRVQRLDFP